MDYLDYKDTQALQESLVLQDWQDRRAFLVKFWEQQQVLEGMLGCLASLAWKAHLEIKEYQELEVTPISQTTDRWE